LKLNYKIV